jgi:hypothetical protein
MAWRYRLVHVEGDLLVLGYFGEMPFHRREHLRVRLREDLLRQELVTDVGIDVFGAAHEDGARPSIPDIPFV